MWDSDPHCFLAPSIAVPKNLAVQRKAKMKNSFDGIQTSITIKLDILLEKLTQCHNRREQVRMSDMNQDHCEYKNCAITKFIQIQTNQLIEPQEHSERYCDVLPVFGFNSAKFDLNIVKFYLFSIIVNERDIEPTVIKKTNQFSLFKFVNFQLLGIMNFFGGATSLDSFLKA